MDECVCLCVIFAAGFTVLLLSLSVCVSFLMTSAKCYRKFSRIYAHFHETLHRELCEFENGITHINKYTTFATIILCLISLSAKSKISAFIRYTHLYVCFGFSFTAALRISHAANRKTTWLLQWIWYAIFLKNDGVKESKQTFRVRVLCTLIISELFRIVHCAFYMHCI